VGLRIFSGVLGQGRILTITDSDSPPTYHIIDHLNIPSERHSKIISSLNWATADESYVPGMPIHRPLSLVVYADLKLVL